MSLCVCANSSIVCMFVCVALRILRDFCLSSAAESLA